MTRILILVWLTALAAACDDEERDTSCIQDTDCRKIDDCCAGCLAVNVSDLIEACDTECVQSACMSTNQAEHVAVCRSGMCQLVPLAQ